MTTQYEMRRQREHKPRTHSRYGLCRRPGCPFAEYKHGDCAKHVYTPFEVPLKWCSYHHRAESREAFGRDRGRADGLAANCKTANRELQARYYGKPSMGAGRS